MSNYYGYTVTKDGKLYNRKGIKVNGYIRCGYKTVTIYKDFKTLSQPRLHRLVATVFIPNPYNLPIVHHIDGDRLNNNVDNLMWMSRRDHTQLHWESGDHTNSVNGTNNGSNSTMTNQEVEDVCVLLSIGYKMISLKDMGYSYENVNCIKRRRTWTDISKDYKWGKLIGIDNIRSSLSRLDVEDICSQLSIGIPVKDLILQGYPKHPCQDIKRRRSWRHISDQYTF